MEERFRDCYVGEKGYESLRALMKNGSELSFDLIKCFNERKEIGQNNARSLRKLADSFRKISGRTKGTISDALKLVAQQIDEEANSQMIICDTVSNQFPVLTRNLIEDQNRERKSLEDSLNGQIKYWKEKRDCADKWRTKHFEKSREIEENHNRLVEAPRTGRTIGKDSTKENFVSTPLIRSCIFPIAQDKDQEKSSTNFEPKHQYNLNSLISRTMDELEEVDRNYHTTTRDVESARQVWDNALCRFCDKMEKIEEKRIEATKNSIEIYTAAINQFSNSISKSTKSFDSLRISTSDDLLVAARSNTQPTETEILLYDIYGEDERNTMDETRRLMSLQTWREILQKDLDELDRLNMNRDEKKETSSSTEEEDGGMRRRKERSKKNVKKPINQIQISSNDNYRLFRCLIEASLFKIEKVFNKKNRRPEPYFEHKDRLALTYNDKNCPVTVIRIPTRNSYHTPPSAPYEKQFPTESGPLFAEPMFKSNARGAFVQKSVPVMATMHIIEPQFDVAVNRAQPQCFIFPAQSRIQAMPVQRSADIYPMLSSAPVIPARLQTPKTGNRLMRVKFRYDAEREDELTIEKGDLITLVKRRDDGWCEGVHHDKYGLFPGNYVEEYS